MPQIRDGRRARRLLDQVSPLCEGLDRCETSGAMQRPRGDRPPSACCRSCWRPGRDRPARQPGTCSPWLRSSRTRRSRRCPEWASGLRSAPAPARPWTARATGAAAAGCRPAKRPPELAAAPPYTPLTDAGSTPNWLETSSAFRVLTEAAFARLAGGRPSCASVGLGLRRVAGIGIGTAGLDRLRRCRGGADGSLSGSYASSRLGRVGP